MYSKRAIHLFWLTKEGYFTAKTGGSLTNNSDVNTHVTFSCPVDIMVIVSSNQWQSSTNNEFYWMCVGGPATINLADKLSGGYTTSHHQ